MNHPDSVLDPTAISARLGDKREHIAEVAARAYDIVRQELSIGRFDFDAFDGWPDGIVIKNAEAVIVYSNDAHRRMFTPGSSPVGRSSHSYLTSPMSERSAAIEQMILDGVPYVECEHSGYGPDGSVYRVQAHKRSLRDLAAPGFAMLGVIRLIERTEADGATQSLDLAAASERFRRLSERDQEICRHTALGVSSRELGERLGMTTRGIELRKQKAFAKLGVAKAVDLARLLVRLQDRGYLDLGV